MLCFNFLGYRRSLNNKGRVSRFSVEIGLSHSAENFVGEPFQVSLVSGNENS